jgi:hypothetical protein
MNKSWLVIFAVLSQACSGDDSAGNPGADASVVDSSLRDGALSLDSAADTATTGCPASWTLAPTTDPAIAVPDAGVLLHGHATGTQDYRCTATVLDAGADAGDDAGDAAPPVAFAWTFVGPEASLVDCNQAIVARHFASDGGASAPEWLASDGTYVIGKKVASVTINGGDAIPWLLLRATAHGGGAGTLSQVAYVQRVNTTGGLAPAAPCDGTSEGAVNQVPYTADYYFSGP